MGQKDGIFAVVQMRSGTMVAENLVQAEVLIADAKAAGAELVALPENFAYMGREETDKFSIAEENGQGPLQAWLSATATRFGIWLVGGTVPLWANPSVVDGKRKVFASCLLYGPGGQRVARYDKMHLFDVQLPNGESYRESNTFQAGAAPVLWSSPWGLVGLAVCYDLRFPELFRRYAQSGAVAMIAPSAFTHLTGQAHWELLTRARAVENLCYMLAPNQGGLHESGRTTWGHSVVVDPWGVVLGECDGDEPGVALGHFRAEELGRVRAALPALGHRVLAGTGEGC